MLISYVDPQTLPGNVLLLRGSLEGALTRSSPGVGAMMIFRPKHRRALCRDRISMMHYRI
jgi:hypothetical protein